MNKRFFGVLACALCSLLGSVPAVAENLSTHDTPELLRILDITISQKKLHRKAFENQVQTILRKTEMANDSVRAARYADIFRLYAHHQSDSALAYLHRMEQTDRAKKDKDYAASILIGRAETYGVMGHYKPAVELLEGIRTDQLSKNTRLQYFHACRTVYGWMTDFGEVPDYDKDFTSLTQAYRDSIIALEPVGINRDIVRADQLIVGGHVREGYALCRETLAKSDVQQRTYFYILLANAAEELGKDEETVRYLAMAAISDLRRGVTEYQALPQLARILSDRGDVTRAYSYLLCTMDDANFCKARLRSFEATSIFPIIERAHEAKIHERQRIMLLVGILVIMVALMLGVFLVLLRRQVHRASDARKELANALDSVRAANVALVKANEQLSTSDKVKETYVARYLQRCRGYIDTLDAYRRQLLKMAKAKQFEDLAARLQGKEFLEEEEKTFYADFDEAFTTLFPSFVDNFNALLVPEARTYPKRDEILNTELRVFALIRLGVTDSNRIAHFLNYSLPTIYSYRSRLRNKSLYSKEEFDRRVMEC